jgi:hypothetical protein
MMPVSQAIEHAHKGDERHREQEFERAVQQAVELGSLHAILGFRDRRFSGRRYRPTDNVEELLGRQEPYDIKGWQRDVPFERYRSM